MILNPFALSCIIVAVLTAILSVFMLLNGLKNKLNRSWLFLTLAIFTWEIGLLGTILVNSKDAALFWQRILYIGTILIPILFFYFSLNLLNRKKIKTVIVGTILSLIFLLLSFTKLFIVDVGSRTDFNYWPVQTGSFYPLFLIYFAFFVIYSIILLKIDSKKYDGIYQKQIQYVYYAALIGFVGGSTNFLLDFGINTYSIGNYSVIIYIIFISYAVFKHHLFSAKVIATELFTFAIWIILLTKIFSSSGLDLIMNVGIFASVVLFGYFLIRSVINEVKQREKIESINKELEVANKKLEDLDKFKNQFFVQARHDLRAPVASIVGYADLIIQGNFGKVSKQVIEAVGKIETCANNMKAMAESFLDTTQFQLGKSPLQLKPDIALQPILNEIVDEFKIKADQNNIYLKLEKSEKDIAITADREKLKSALSNIVSNAIKFTKQGGVDLRFENDDKNVKIIISDTGIGIPADKIKSIFEQKFERTEQAQKTAEGKGVGLYLSGQIIKYHQGKAWAESGGEGKGSIFYIELPLKIDDKNLTETSMPIGKI